MQMIESAGIVVYRQYNNNVEYLILHYPHGHWDFPKGKIESGESKQEAALRELYEETGLYAGIKRGFEESLSYDFKSPNGIPVHKIVYFFVGKVQSDKVNLSSEHIDHKWLLLDDALEQLTYTSARRLLQEADRFVHEMS